MNKLSFELKITFSGPSADDQVEELYDAARGEKYTSLCFGFYSDDLPKYQLTDNENPFIVIEEDIMGIEQGCLSLKSAINHLQTLTLDSFKSMDFRLQLDSDNEDVFKDEHQIQLPNSKGIMISRLEANDMDTFSDALVEIDQTVDKLLTKYT